jgi:hypothetical protein
MFGEFLSPVGFTLLLLASLASIVLFRLRVNMPARVTAIYLVFVWTWLLSNSFFSLESNHEFAVKAYFLNVGAVLSAIVLFANNKGGEIFFDSLAFLIAIIGFSALITYMLAFVTPIDTLYLGEVSTPNYSNSGHVYFPFTIRYANYNFGSISLLRIQGIFREAGIFQAFAVSMLAYLYLQPKRSIFLSTGCLLSLLFTFSTAGIVSLFLLLLLLLLWPKNNTIATDKELHQLLARWFIGIGLLFILPFVIIYTPGVGLADKYESHEVSVTDRSNAVLEGLSKGLVNPLGSGLYSGGEEHNSGINLFAATSQIGVIGLLLAIAIFLVPFVFIKALHKREYALIIAPIFVTGLTSQPLLDAPLVYILLMALIGKLNSGTVENSPHVPNKQPSIVYHI